MKLEIFEIFETFETSSFGYDKFNIPVWNIRMRLLIQ